METKLYGTKILVLLTSRCGCDVFQVDTNLDSPDDFVSEGVPGIKGTYSVAPYSSILLEAK